MVGFKSWLGEGLFDAMSSKQRDKLVDIIRKDRTFKTFDVFFVGGRAMDAESGRWLPSLARFKGEIDGLSEFSTKKMTIELDKSGLVVGCFVCDVEQKKCIALPEEVAVELAKELGA